MEPSYASPHFQAAEQAAKQEPTISVLDDFQRKSLHIALLKAEYQYESLTSENQDRYRSYVLSVLNQIIQSSRIVHREGHLLTQIAEMFDEEAPDLTTIGDHPDMIQLHPWLSWPPSEAVESALNWQRTRTDGARLTDAERESLPDLLNSLKAQLSEELYTRLQEEILTGTPTPSDKIAISSTVPELAIVMRALYESKIIDGTRTPQAQFARAVTSIFELPRRQPPISADRLNRLAFGQRAITQSQMEESQRYVQQMLDWINKAGKSFKGGNLPPSSK